MSKQIEALKPEALPCCGFTDASAVKWNPCNQVVQCHNCGQVYTALPPAPYPPPPLPYPPPQQEPVAYGMWDTMLGKDNRMMMVRLDKGQDGCTVPLYTAHGITKGNT